MLWLTLLFACAKGDDSCGVIADENWQWSGDCPQMITPCDLVCSDGTLTIDYEADGGMTMGMPYSATVEGTNVVFEDGDSVGGCTGVIANDGNILGQCSTPNGTCDFLLYRN